MRIAVLSDIHGNSWALKSVLEDIENRNADLIVNLGDTLYGPLNPGETFDLIKSYNIFSISGNQDRFIIENIGKGHDFSTLHYVINEINEDAIDWLKSLPQTGLLNDNVFMCHGTPESDTTYLLENISDSSASINDTDRIDEMLEGITRKIILCGHSHTQRTVKTHSHIIINPGSVGLPAYLDDLPVYHKIENSDNQARYCIIDIIDNSIETLNISVPYDFEKAAGCATKNNRMDWAGWIRTGKA